MAEPAAAPPGLVSVATGGEPVPFEEKVVYLTFDDGPSPWTQQVLDVLAEFNARGTFFVIGRQAEVEGDLIRRTHDAGHGVANHSYSHTSYRGMGWPSFKWEVETTAAALGEYESKCIRPPYGHTDGNTANFTQRLGYSLALWNVDPQDWRLPGASTIASRILANVRPGAVVLMHDGGGDRSQTVAALRIVLQQLTAEGWVFRAVCREDPMPDVYGTPKPDEAPPILAAGAPAVPVGTAGDGGGEGKVLAQEAPPVPNSSGAIRFPLAGAAVSRTIPVTGFAASDTFVKWQLDLLVNGSEELFLALGETPQPEVATLFTWDTTLYPNGVHMLRLRVVYEGSNYDEYFVHVIVAN